METEEIQQVYWGIGKVADKFGVQTSTIRFWTSCFGLRVKTNGKGDRKFTEKDIQNLQVIHDLLKVKKFTVEGALIQFKKRSRSEEVVVAPV